MHSKKAYVRQSSSSILPKPNKKYVPTQQEANIIINYFLHNNFQDFNTWQQISKSRCQFQYNEPKSEVFQCKVSLKWDDASMPMIVQVGVSRNKKNAKKKALHKLIENLIFLGLIGFGFKEADFIKRLPKRRKQSSEEESQISPITHNDRKFQPLLMSKNYQTALTLLTYKNFEKLLSISIKESNLVLFTKIIRKLQNINHKQQLNIGFNAQDLDDGEWQMFKQPSNQNNPFQEDLAEVLKYYKLQNQVQGSMVQKCGEKPMQRMELPCQKLNTSQGKISFQFFHPIEFKLIFRRNLQQSGAQQRKKERSDYFNDFYKEIPMPKFENEDLLSPLPYKVIQKFFNIILEFSYNYRLIINLLSIFEREVTVCQLDSNTSLETQQFFLRNMGLITAQFAFLLNKKMQIPSVSIEGFINIQAEGILNFTSKQPEQVFLKKISKKLNTNQIQQMQEFANQQYILLVSKIDAKIIYVGQILQCWPSIKIKCKTFESEDQRQKLPFTLYKISNGKLYNRLVRSITHTAKNGLQKLRFNSFVIEQKPTQPLLSIITQLLAEWISLTETVLIVSDSFSEIYAYLVEKGFKVAKITQKIDERGIIKKQIVCCNPAGVCADAIKNYAFTRVIIEGAQRISQPMSTLGLDKGYKKIYFIGDPQLPTTLALTKYAKNRNLTKSLFENLIEGGIQTYNFGESIEPNYLDVSILQFLNKFFYFSKLNKMCGFESPSIKGFPWPSEKFRIAFIQIKHKPNQKNNLIKQVEMCCQIVANVLRSGFIAMNQIACRVTSPNARALLTATLYNMLKKYPDCGVNPDLAIKSIDFVSGSKFQQKILSILIGDTHQFTIKHLIAGLQEGKRGFIVLADFEQLIKKVEWVEILRYANENKLILVKENDN